MNKTVYVVQTQVVNLGNIPFSSGDEVKPAFRPLFTSKKCFTDLRTSILDSSRVEPDPENDQDNADEWREPAFKPIPLPGRPFIPSLGMLCFNTRSAVFSDNEERTLLAKDLARREKFWDPKAHKSSKRFNPDAFGFAPELEDQRMNMLYFELHHPVFLTASLEDKKTATGRIFIHMYPSGYMVLHLAIRLLLPDPYSAKELAKVIYETQPWRKNTSWEWTSRIAQGKLQDVTDTLTQIILKSIFQIPPSRKVRKSNWFTSIKLFSGWDTQQLANVFFIHNVKTINIKRFEDDFFNEYEYHHESDPGKLKQGLIVSKEGLILCLPEYYNEKRKKSLGEFWKTLAMVEFTLLKEGIYSDYVDFLRPEIEKLRDFRLSLKRKMMKDDLLKFSVYRSELPRLLLALDKHTHSASPYYRFVYSSISDAIGLYDRYDKVKELVKEWTGEVEQWEPILSIFWKNIIGPLRALVGK
jgi:hypothetical protein